MRQSGAQRLDRALARLGLRLGPKTVLVPIVLGVVFSLVSAAVSLLFEARYLNLSFSQALPLYLIWTPLLVGLAFLGIAGSASQLRTIFTWTTSGRRPADAARTWLALVKARRVVKRAFFTGMIGIPFGAVYVVLHYHKPWYGLVVISFGALLGGGGVWVLLVFTSDLLLRPLVRDVAVRLPPDFEPQEQGMSLRAKAVAPLPVVTLYAAVLVGAFANASNNGTLRFTIAVGVALITVAIATAIFLLIARSVLSPIDDVIAAMRRVRAGDPGSPVPVVTDDELGELTASFNEMLTELTRRADELRASRERIVAAADEERRRVERDLHDGAQQQLVLLRLKLGLLERDPSRRELLPEIRADVERAIAELRDLAHGLYPQALQSDGLAGALKEAVGRAPIPATLDCDGAGRYRPELEAAVYFCCLEALQNAAKHAGEDARAQLRLSERDRRLTFEVSDDGRGFDPATAPQSSGLQNMTDRIGALGGEVTVNSAPGAGTTIAGEVPLGIR